MVVEPVGSPSLEKFECGQDAAGRLLPGEVPAVSGDGMTSQGESRRRDARVGAVAGTVTDQSGSWVVLPPEILERAGFDAFYCCFKLQMEYLRIMV